jgi:N-acetylglucosaminyl-diphospho-decaprenol L-rhamnosyltransferase
MQKVFVIIVTYNGADHIRKCLTSLSRLDHEHKIIIVDNGSSDGTQDIVRDEFPDVEFVQSPSNLGFGKANNIGIGNALSQGADAIFLLNQDAYVLDGSFDQVLNALFQNPTAGIVSPIHLAGDETNLDFAFYKYCDPQKTPGFLGDAARNKPKELYESEFVNAAAWVVRADMIKKIGAFHPAFDHYGEDREYISRLHRSGHKLYISSQLKIVHNRPQRRSGNKHHRFFDNQKRVWLQALIEGTTTKGVIFRKIVKHAMYYLLLAHPRKSMEVLKAWIWLSKRAATLNSKDQLPVKNLGE